MLKQLKPKKLFLLTTLWLLLVLSVFVSFAGLLGHSDRFKVEAATSSTINFQARLLTSTGALVPDGFYNVEFKLYSVSSGGTAQWTETYYDSNGVTAGNDNRVRVVNGYLSVYLGSLTSFPSINWDQQEWVSLNIGGTTQTATPTWDGEMSPRLQLTAVPYAFRAAQLAKLTGANTSTLDFATQTGARSILLPDESGTLCIQGSTNCNFAAGSGDADYIQNGVSAQTANFNITGNGTIGGTLQASTVNATSAIQLNGTQIVDSNRNLANILTITAAVTSTATSGTNLNTTLNLTASPSSAPGAQTDFIGLRSTTSSASANANSNTRLFGASTNTSFTGAGTLGTAYGNFMQTSNAGGGTITTAYGGNGVILNSSNGTITTGTAIQGTINSTGTGTISNARALDANVINNGGGTLTNAYGLRVETPTNTGVGSTIGTAYGIYIGDQTGASIGTSYGLYFAGTGVTSSNGITWNNDTNFYRSAAAQLTTNGDLIIQGGDLDTNQTTFNLLASATAALNIGPGSNTAVSINLAGGSGATGCTVAGATGNLTCDGAISTNATSGIQGWWTRTGSSLSPTNAGDAITTTGNISTTSSGTITSAGLLTGSAGLTITGGTANINASGSGATNIGSTGSGGAVAIQSASTIGLTSGTTLSLTSTGSNAINITPGGGTNTGVIIKPTTNSTAALQIQNAAGTSTLFNVDTTTSNLITNPSFEVDTSGWATTGSGTGLAISRNTTAANVYHGIGSLQIVTASSAANTGASVTAFTSSITPGTYTLNFIARATVSFSTFNVTITGGGAPTCLTGQTVGTGFQRYSCTFTSSGTNVTAINFITTTSTQRTIYLDAVQLVSGSNSIPYTMGTIQLGGVVNSPSVFQNASDSTTAFQIQNAAGTSNLLIADTTNGRIAIGQAPAGTLTNLAKLEVNGQIRAFSGATGAADGGGSFFASGFSSSSGQAQFVGNWNSTSLWGIGAFSGSSSDNAIRIGNVAGDASSGTAGVWGGTQNINLVIGGAGTGALSLGTGALPTSMLTVGGSALFHNTSNSTTAFQIQDSGASGSLLLNADTINNKINLIGDVNVGSRYDSRLFSDTFESGGLGLWDGRTGTISVSSSTVHDGKYAAQVNPSSGTGYAWTYFPDNATAYARAWVYVSSQTSSNADLLSLEYSSDTGSTSFTVYRNSGNLWFWNEGTGGSTNSGTALSTGAWHLIEMRVTTGNPTGVSQVWLDGNSTPVVNLSGQNNSTNPLDTVRIGDNSGSRTFNAYIDDVVADTVATGTASSLNVDDSLHVGGTGSFGNDLMVNVTDNDKAQLRLEETNDRGFNLFYDAGANNFAIQANDAGGLTNALTIDRVSSAATFDITNGEQGPHTFSVLDGSSGYIIDTDSSTANVGIATAAASDAKLYALSGSYTVIRAKGTGTNNLLQLQNNTSTVLQVSNAGNITAGGSATGTTKTTEATNRNSVTTVTLTSAGFANNDVIRLVRSGTYYYTRIVSGGGTTSLTVSPAVSYDASSTVTKYNVQYLGNDGSTFTGTTRSDNSYFQGYFTGGIVTGTGSTIYSDANISSTNDLKIQAANSVTIQNTANSTTALQVQNTAGTNIFNVDTSNNMVTITGAAAGSGSQTFNYTGGTQTFTVPAGVTSINVTLYGAGGGQGGQGNTASTGGQTTGTLAVTPGQVLTIYVGGAGGNGTAAGAGGTAGYNGGGAGGNAYSSSYPGGGGGGGSSMIKDGATLKAAAGGGGGGAGWGTSSTASGGNGGGTTGNTGNSSRPGTGGTQSAGGTGYGSGSSTYCGTPATDGSAGQGGAGGIGAGGPFSGASGSGGGGGGYYGGGGGDCGTATGNGGGGGGSGYSALLTGASMTTGGNSGNGQVAITWAPPALLVQDASNNTYFSANSAGAFVNGNLDADTYSVGGVAGADITCAAGTVLQAATVSKGIVTGGSCASSSYARATKSANQSITTGSWTATLSFNTESEDTDSYHNTVTNNSRLTAPSNGWYNITAQVTFDVNGTGQRGVRIMKNGTTIIGESEVNASTSVYTQFPINTQVFLAAGDYIEIQVSQNSGGNLNVIGAATGGNPDTYFAISRIGSVANTTLTIGTIDSQTKSSDGAVISGSSLYLQTADATNPGLVSTSTQTFAGAKTFSSLITGSAGLSVTGAASSINTSSNFATNINTGTSTGTISIGNNSGNPAVNIDSGTGAINIGTGAQARTINIGTGGAAQTVTLGSTTSTSPTIIQGGSSGITLNSAGAVNIKTTGFNIQDTSGNNLWQFGTSNPSTLTCGLFGTNDCAITAGSSLTINGGNTAKLQVGSSSTDGNVFYLVLDSYNGASDPAGPTAGGMYYNTSKNSFRCYENGAWKNCINGIAETVETYRGVTSGVALNGKGAAATILIVPIYFPGQTTVNEMRVKVTTTALGAAGDVGLYNSAGTLVLNGGSSSLTTATGQKVIAPVQTGANRIIEPGQYYMAITYNSTTGGIGGQALATAGDIKRVGTIATGGGLVLPSSVTLSGITSGVGMAYGSFNN